MSVVAEFPPGTTIEEAQERATEIDDVVVSVLGDELDRSQYVRGNERVIDTFIDLTPIDSRSTTAPQFVEQIEAGVADIEGVRVTVGQSENGPPPVEFPFAAQITVDPDTVDEGQAFAEALRDDLIGRQLTVGGSDVTITDAIVGTDGEVLADRRPAGHRGARPVRRGQRPHRDPQRDRGLRGRRVRRRRTDGGGPRTRMPSRSTSASSPTTRTTSPPSAWPGLVALVLMLLLITIQFRSLAQSLLIFLAVPFSFFGVFTALSVTDNPLSFLAVVGFIALIGVAVNNTILLVDAANQERRNGATAGEAIGSAVTSRFRPLVATTITTVVGLYPLSISDPFWESLGFTLMGGLVSSTILVLLSFPAFYLGLEAVRTPVRNAVRRRRGRPEIA